MPKKDRIQTPHVGSLPRPDSLVSLLRARHKNEPIDKAAFDRAARDAVRDCVAMQVEVGIDSVSDGEMAKSISYAYYVQDRLTGLESAEAAAAKGVPLRRFPRLAIQYPDFPDYTAFRARLTDGPASAKPPVCTGPLTYRDIGPVTKDRAIFREAAAAAGASLVLHDGGVARRRRDVLVGNESLRYRRRLCLRVGGGDAAPNTRRSAKRA